VDHNPQSTARRLYDLASASNEIDEAAFHDAVSRNLKRGRFLLLIVGDGIREGVEAMAEFLQQHAGFHFTLAFIEIALFQAPGGFIAQPRVLVRDDQYRAWHRHARRRQNTHQGACRWTAFKWQWCAANEHHAGTFF
jgi:hypothetical protein